jgi:large subunit ribosomal protein L29
MAEKHNDLLERLRGLSDTELAETLANERRKLYEMRTKNVTRQLENKAALAQTRKQIARVLTLQTERINTAQGE